MILLKVEDGKREVGNFYLTSNFGDFAGSAIVIRDIVENTMSLISNDKIERSFPYEEFVIDIKKRNWGQYHASDFSKCYIGTANEVCGIKDDAQGEHPYWRLLRQDGYIQVYSSDDGKLWSNLGGDIITEPIIKQGFQKRGDSSFVLEEYTVYKRAIITLLNFPENTLAILQDEDGNEVRRRLFDADLKCEMYIDNCMKGKFIFTNPIGGVVFTSPLLDLKFGDTYILSPYELEVIYHNQAVINPTMLDSLCEAITIKNVSTSSETYRNLTISTKDESEDLIQLSFNGTDFSDTLAISELKPEQEVVIYVKIYKSIDNHNFQVRDFQLVVE